MIISFLLSINFSYAQTDSVYLQNPSVKHAVVAARFCQEMKFDEAKNEIELAFLTDEESNELYSWYVKGYVYKEIYKRFESTDRNSKSREIATKSFLQAKKMAIESGSDFNIDAALKFLSNSYYNDAIAAAADFSSQGETDWGYYYSKYLEIAKIQNNNLELLKLENELYKIRAAGYHQIWMIDTKDENLDSAKFYYESALKTDSLNCDLWYNLAVLHYSAYDDARIQLAGDNEESLKQVNSGHLVSAEQAFTKAESNCPDRVDILTGMLNVCKLLNDQTRIVQYEEKIELESAKE